MVATISKEMPAIDDLIDGPKSSEIDSNFRLIVVAAKRSKQLLHGSRPRIPADPLKRRNTSIALEETRRGLVPFKIIVKPLAVNAQSLHEGEI
ncbi:MAG TPA: DNA-directed RNA polymerase subunit omega [Pyrinomonadaceae bacterium]|jgi:DNA-directed RNA polymerase omega subunit|nr:DNA-directed RNA polymerase subunit omega [Pyrinomonadaceae bacterium]